MHDEVVAQGARRALGLEGEDDPRVALDVPQLLLPAEVRGDEVVAIEADPYLLEKVGQRIPVRTDNR